MSSCGVVLVYLLAPPVCVDSSKQGSKECCAVLNARIEVFHVLSALGRRQDDRSPVVCFQSQVGCQREFGPEVSQPLRLT